MLFCLFRKWKNTIYCPVVFGNSSFPRSGFVQRFSFCIHLWDVHYSRKTVPFDIFRVDIKYFKNEIQCLTFTVLFFSVNWIICTLCYFNNSIALHVIQLSWLCYCPDSVKKKTFSIPLILCYTWNRHRLLYWISKGLRTRICWMKLRWFVHFLCMFLLNSMEN